MRMNGIRCLHLGDWRVGQILLIVRQDAIDTYTLRCRITRLKTAESDVEAEILPGSNLSPVELALLPDEARELPIEGCLCRLRGAFVCDTTLMYGVRSLAYDVVELGQSLYWVLIQGQVATTFKVDLPVTDIGVDE